MILYFLFQQYSIKTLSFFNHNGRGTTHPRKVGKDRQGFV